MPNRNNPVNQVLSGCLVKWHREDKGLTQIGLAEKVYDQYDEDERKEKYTSAESMRVSLVRWEVGDRKIPDEFLKDFTKVLKLSDCKLNKIIHIKDYGYDAIVPIGNIVSNIERIEKELKNLLENMQGVRDSEHTRVDEIKDELESLLRETQRLRESDTEEIQSIATRLDRLQTDVQRLTQRASTSLSVTEVVKDILLKMAPPLAYVVTVGYLLSALDLNRIWMLLAYVAIGIAIVSGQVAIRWRNMLRLDKVGDLFFLSVFFMLNTPLLQGAFTRMDPYGFHTLQPFTGSAMPLLIAMVANLALSLAASIMFMLLRNWLEQTDVKLFARAVGTTLPPLLFVYVNILLFGNPGAWVYFLIVLGVLFGATTAIIAFKDDRCALDERDAWMVPATFWVIVLLCSLGVLGMVVNYLEPSMAASAHHNILSATDEEFGRLGIPAPEYFDELGYPEHEYLERIRLGIVWMGLATIVYLSTVIGGYLMAAIHSRTRG